MVRDLAAMSRPTRTTRAAAKSSVTVVVCTAGQRPADLLRCLASLQCQTVPAAEILVVDNSRHSIVDADAVTALGARVIRQPRGGLDVARTVAAAAATGTAVAYIDDDCEAAPDWLANVTCAFADEAVACVTGRVVAANASLITATWFEARFSFDRGPTPIRFHRTDNRPWFPLYPSHLGSGCNLAVRRETLRALDGFDAAIDMGTAVAGGGDLDFFARLLDNGFTAAYVPTAMVRHHHRARRRSLVKQFFGYGATVTALCLKSALTRPGLRREALRFLRHYLKWETARMAARVRRRDSLPLYLLLVEMCGHLWGPVGYLLGRLRTRGYRSPW